MKQEYKEKIELAKKLLIYENSISFEEQENRFNYGFGILEELVNTKDTEVLCELIDFFTPENAEYGGFEESLESYVQYNFTPDQIIEVLYKKFDSFMKKCSTRCVHICWDLFGNEEYFEKFRKMFNRVKSKNSALFLQELCDWAPEGEEQINIIKKDMKKW